MYVDCYAKQVLRVPNVALHSVLARVKNTPPRWGFMLTHNGCGSTASWASFEADPQMASEQYKYR